MRGKRNEKKQIKRREIKKRMQRIEDNQRDEMMKSMSNKQNSETREESVTKRGGGCFKTTL